MEILISFAIVLAINVILCIALLTIFVTGVPILEKGADERWGGEVAYQEYKKRTAKLIPFLW